MTKKQTIAEKLTAHSLEMLLGKSDLVAVDVVVTGRVISPDGTIDEVDLASFSAPPRMFSKGSRGFYLYGKVQDPTPTGQMNGVEYQIGCNVTACKSAEWVAE